MVLAFGGLGLQRMVLCQDRGLPFTFVEVVVCCSLNLPFIADLQVVPGAFTIIYVSCCTFKIKCFRLALITFALMCLWSWSRSWCLWFGLGLGLGTCGLGLALSNMVLITSVRKCREVRLICPITESVNNLEAVMRHSSYTV